MNFPHEHEGILTRVAATPPWLVSSSRPLIKNLVNPEFNSLLRPHPIWSSLDGNPYQTKAAHIQALLLTGRYRTERLCRFWSSNKDGLCILEKCFNLKISESIEHFLLHCDSLSDERRRLVLYSLSFAAENPILKGRLCVARPY